MGDSVRVAVRVRPFNTREKDRNARVIIDMDGQNTSITDPETNEKKSFAFDYSYWSHDGFVEDDTGYNVAVTEKYSTQRRVYEDLGVAVLDNAWAGYNCSLFAYGQTGSGKSYSMVGYGANKGIIPISCDEMFKKIGRNDDANRSYQVTVSMLEIYNEKIKDLLDLKVNTPGVLKLKQNDSGVYVEGLSAMPVPSYKDMENQMEKGTTNRTVAATNMNATSSRAHTVFTIVFTIVTNTPMGKSEVQSKINLVDLAGSERAESTGATGDRLKEGCAINQSLTSLGNVISALADASSGKKNVFIPYRNSALTRLLQDALGGNSKTIMIAALSPADINFEETLSTLRYADRAKRIKNSAKKNENPTEKLIRELKEENERLKKALESGGGALPGAGPAANDPEEIERLKREFEEQLKQNELLMAERQKTWEQRLTEAQATMNVGVGGQSRERTDEERKTKPHLVNLNEDPLMSDCLVYILKSGETKIGKKDAPVEQDIVLSGLNIQKEHCVFENTDGKIFVTPKPGAKMFVNGNTITEKTPVPHGSRVIFGNNHIYRFNDPPEASRIRAEREKMGENAPPPDVIDWEYAQKELQLNQGIGMNLHDKQREMDVQTATAKLAYEKKVQELEEQMRQQKALLEMSLGPNGVSKQIELMEKARSLEEELEKQKKAAQMMDEAAGKRKREMALLEDLLARSIPEVNECNMMSAEMKRSVTFELKLVDAINDGPKIKELAAFNSKKMEIMVKVQHAPSKSVWMWSLEKFENRLHMIREIYNNFMELGGAQPNIPKDQDPFWDPPEDVVIGRAQIYLQAISYLFDVEETTPIVDYKGKKDGSIRIGIYPCTKDGSKISGGGDAAEEMEIEKPEDLIGKRLDLLIEVTQAQGLPPSLLTNLYIQYRFYLDDPPYRSECISTKSSSPLFNYKKRFTIEAVTKDFLEYLKHDAITFKIIGQGEASEPSFMAAGERTATNSALNSARQPQAVSPGRAAQGGAPPHLLEEQLNSIRKEKENAEGSLRKEIESVKKDKSTTEAALLAQIDALKKEKTDLESFYKAQVETLRKQKEAAESHKSAILQEEEAIRQAKAGNVPAGDIEKLRSDAEVKKADLEITKADADIQKAEVALAKAEAERKRAELDEAKAEGERKKAELMILKADAEIKSSSANPAAVEEAEKRKAEAATKQTESEGLKKTALEKKALAEAARTAAEKQKVVANAAKEVAVRNREAKGSPVAA
eukprot:CAMPEP_0184337354 /NCGR_PEP_ID=MMETSP1089-20130417/5742_1 /TAXON_ID=38269 ORGANISM="Gloeochaete wittrockiana, Strain SAG46.84" /NCGR_SAMPLE_ID=MMETSP1089 /ASSEMBLY_ACC=CAM_ASM_000445 /LENGTH=1226 /DNA_ID=CAMNT_0026663017 /DNA_START=221 /DNA_END=3901 /DNA_ORIENTATION=-